MCNKECCEKECCNNCQSCSPKSTKSTKCTIVSHIPASIMRERIESTKYYRTQRYKRKYNRELKNPLAPILKEAFRVKFSTS